jgi:hypothetical protein
MPFLEGEVFFLGTAIVELRSIAAEAPRAGGVV